MSSAPTDDLEGGPTALFGAVGGAVAYVLGYLVTYVLTADTIENSLTGRIVEFATGEPSTWKLVGWVFYNAHFAETRVPGLFGGSSLVNFIAETDAFSALLYVFPAAFLLVAGLALARAAGATDASIGGIAGGAAIVGYLPLTVVGAVLFGISFGDTTAGPDLVAALFLAGIVWPVVFGGLGGAAGGATGE